MFEPDILGIQFFFADFYIFQHTFGVNITSVGKGIPFDSVLEEKRLAGVANHSLDI